jgi:hypothetical protein
MVELAYCDFFVTGAKALHENCRVVAAQGNLSCQVCKSILQINSPGCTAPPSIRATITQG